jgi:hypothetical protein
LLPKKKEKVFVFIKTKKALKLFAKSGKYFAYDLLS